jgi:hypothetical protein
MNIESATYIKDIVNGVVTEDNIAIKVIADGITLMVPISEANRHYQMIMEWVAEGNTITDNGGGE